MLPRVIMKFGGTSLGDAAATARTVRHVTREQRMPLVVVSAVGGVTDLLIAAADLALTGQDSADTELEIRRRHEQILTDLALGPKLIDDELALLSHLLQGIDLLRELSPRVRDLLLSLGERMSVKLVAAALDQAGRRARAWPAWELGLRTTDRHGRADPLPESYADVLAALEEQDDATIPVVTGFIAKSTSGEITTLGRGGSDLSAAILGVAAGVEEIQIWTDVPGILCADPRAVPGARVVPAITFDEAAELAFFGARVLHPRTIAPARDRGIPVRVLGTFQVDPDDPTPTSEQGTLIDDGARPAPVRGVALRQDVQSLHIHSLRMLEVPGFLSRVFEILARHQISVDVVATSEVSVSMTFDGCGGDLSVAIEEISGFAQVELSPRRSLLCVVGSGLREDTGLLSRIFRILADNQIPVRVISQGASRINITLVTDPPFGDKAMRALHDELF